MRYKWRYKKQFTLVKRKFIAAYDDGFRSFYAIYKFDSPMKMQVRKTSSEAEVFFIISVHLVYHISHLNFIINKTFFNFKSISRYKMAKKLNVFYKIVKYIYFHIEDDMLL